ncbi:MAG: YbhB/YbcL family Raf kinase inhibitor-like protein [Actinobacteria bacterium]|nr:YbhB/YbcL family Raf kinase inhibitor-like protein [Actinomycetota bacterium]
MRKKVTFALTALFVLNSSFTIPSVQAASKKFTLTSPVVKEKGMLPAEYTCDGARATPELRWSNPPKGSKSFALLMSHIPPTGPGAPETPHWYWIVWDIPANSKSLPKNSASIGKLGGNSVNRDIGYAPPCSKGPGEKLYTYTIYALSKSANLGEVSSASVSREILLNGISKITLGKATLNVNYTRPEGASDAPPPPPQ